MSYLLDQRSKYRNANKQFDKDLNEEKYNESVKYISQKDRDTYMDEMVKESSKGGMFDK